MIDPRHIVFVKETVSAFDPHGRNRYFVFGSATRKKRFGDVDIGVTGNSKAKKSLPMLRNMFEASTFPYFVDVVDFDEASPSFTEYVKNNEEPIWIN